MLHSYLTEPDRLYVPAATPKQILALRARLDDDLAEALGFLPYEGGCPGDDHKRMRRITREPVWTETGHWHLYAPAESPAEVTAPAPG